MNKLTHENSLDVCQKSFFQQLSSDTISASDFNLVYHCSRFNEYFSRSCKCYVNKIVESIFVVERFVCWQFAPDGVSQSKLVLGDGPDQVQFTTPLEGKNHWTAVSHLDWDYQGPTLEPDRGGDLSVSLWQLGSNP